MAKNYAGGLLTANQNANFSGLFNGATSYLSVAGAAQYAIATSTTPFTVEAWIRPTVAGGLIFAEEFGAPTIVMACGLAASNDISAPTGLVPTFGWYNGSAWVNAAASTTAVLLNVWSHVAFVFTGSTSKIYINGIDVTKSSAPTPSTTWGITATNGTNWFIGRRWDTTAAGLYFKGNISNFRFVNGTPVYTGNFAPPARLSAITNTVLLTCQSSTFFDASTYNAAITNNAGTVVSQDNPYYTLSNPALGAATPGVWTISEAAAAAGQRSWNMYDPYFNLTTAMIHGNGANGANNNTFLDSSTNNFTITRAGNTTQGTFTPFSEPNGYWSNFFNGTSDSLTVPAGTDFAYGTGDFTVEGWFYATSTLAAFGSMLWSQVASGHNYFYVAAGEGASPVVNNFIQFVGAASGGGSPIYSSTRFSLNSWNHFAVVRISGLIRVYLNGVGGTATSNTTNFNNTTYVPNIARYTGGTSWFPGYISNLRVVKGVGVYTGDFTVPTAPLTATQSAGVNIAAITSGQTVFLGLQSNRFVDNSSTPKTISSTGTTRTLTYSPLYSPTAYTPAARGGGMYFDGTGDYLSLNGVTLSNSTFTAEAWIYPTTTISSTRMVVGSWDGSTLLSWTLSVGNTNTLIFEATSPGTYTTVVSIISANNVIAVNAWNHIAVVRNGNVFTIYANGTSVGTATNSLTIFNGAAQTKVGSNTNNQAFFGFISSPRVVVGTAVYTANFTPPTAPLTPITNTQLLLSGTNGSFIDNAANLTIETVNTTITTSQSKYGVGSMLFNGSTAYASLLTPAGNGASTVLTLGDFTVEGWVYPITANAQKAIFFLNGNTSSYGVRIDHTASANIQLLVSTTGAAHAINVTSTATISTGAWSHIALVRQGPAFIVYLNGVAVITSTAVGVTTAVMAGTLSFLGVLGGLANYFFGAISDFRITNYARYLGNFVPPTSTLQNQ